MQEVWRDIPGFDGYQASNIGRIRSTTRVVRCRNGVRTHRGKLLKPFVARQTGYTQIMIGRRKLSTHRLVALAWCDGYFDGAVVDHVNGVRDDNRPENLNWVTRSENNRRSFKMGRQPTCLGLFSADHPTAKSVVSICIRTGKETVWGAAMDAVRAGYDSSCISRCCAGKIGSHRGHIWKMLCAEKGVDIWGDE